MLKQPMWVWSCLHACHVGQRAVPCGRSTRLRIAWQGDLAGSSVHLVYCLQHTEALLLLDNTTDFVPEAHREANGNSSSVVVV